MDGKKQFRLFDAYRAISTGMHSNIKGIKSYSIFDGAQFLRVEYSNGVTINYGISAGRIEDDLLQAVRSINKYLKSLKKMRESL